MVKVTQIPALFLPPIRSVDDKKPNVTIPNVKKNNSVNNGRPNEQKKNDAKSCAYLLRANEKRAINQGISGIC